MKKRIKIGFSLIELSIVILVIGILVGGVAQGSRIINLARLKSAQSLTASSPVNVISGLSVWFETTSENSFNNNEEVNLSTIGQWSDINTQSKTPPNTVVQVVNTKKPLYIANGIGGLPVVRFDGVDDNLSNTAAVSLPFGNSARTLFVVYGNAQIVGGQHFIMHYGDENVSNRVFDYAACYNSAKAAIHMENTDYLTLQNTCDQKNYIASIVYKGLSNTNIANNTEFYLNKVFSPRDNPSSRTDGALGSSANVELITTSSDLYIGSKSAGVDPFKGDVGEIIMFNRQLSISERQSVEDYLSTKWSIK